MITAASSTKGAPTITTISRSVWPTPPACCPRMAAQESGLHVAAAGPFLILEMDKEKLNRAALAISMPFTGSMSYG